MKNKRIIIVLVSVYVLSAIWWLSIFLRGIQNTTENYLFNIPLALIPVIAATYILFYSQKHKAQVEYFLAIVNMAAALGAWGLGNVVYFVYELVLKRSAPLYSLADVAYFVALIFWLFGFECLSRRIGVLRGVHKSALISLIIYLSLIILAGLYAPDSFLNVSIQRLTNSIFLLPDLFILLHIAWTGYLVCVQKHNSIKVFFMFIALGFAINYIADLKYMFLDKDYFYGSWIDMLFLTAIFFESLGVLELLKIQPSQSKKI